ncbi:hypothetical protein HIM_05622 [Hirsutella minnesotensis 3608]|uniref:Integrase catalytic domain-containing protein n=1 Tax=Hirsutella minnesotensis 3608 TaxID=1043627 RepID=A0A0F7ZKC1_9HYPO|nr:hypothetical protein HIM_05622 [Hirsutella minnesotensis 3608]
MSAEPTSSSARGSSHITAPPSPAQIENQLAKHPAVKIDFFEIDPALWYTPVVPSEGATPIHINTRVAHAWVAYERAEITGEDLFLAFQYDFEGWTAELFAAMTNTARPAFRKYLRDRGVTANTTNSRLRHDLALLAIVRQDPDTWQEDLHENAPTAAPITSNASITTPITSIETPTPEPQPEPQPEQQPSRQPPSTPTQPQPQVQWEGVSPTPFTQAPTSYSFSHRTRVDSKPPTDPLQPDFDPYHTLPPRNVPNARPNGQALALFLKIWNKEDSYSGQPYDLLDDKIRTFLSVCYTAQVSENQFHAILPRILSDRAKTFYDLHIDKKATFAAAYLRLKQHFDTGVNHEHYYTDWTTTTFNTVRSQYSDKNLHYVLDTLLDKLQLCQRALGDRWSGEENLRTAVVRACRGVPELQQALFKAPASCEELFADLRSAIETSATSNTQFYVDRRYQRNRPPFQRREPSFQRRPADNSKKKTCFVCGKAGCWSTKHTADERKQARMHFLSSCAFVDTEPPNFAAFLAEHEGHEMDNDDVEEVSDDEDDKDQEGSAEQYFAQTFLANHALLHRLTREDAYAAPLSITDATQFLIDDRYTTRYQGIMLDTGASNFSTVGIDQFYAWQREDPEATIDATRAGQACISFGDGPRINSLGIVRIVTAFGPIDFHVLPSQTPFLLSLADMDRIGVVFNNQTNEVIRGELRVPAVRKWGHAWFHLGKEETARVFLTEHELRRLHRRFGHPAATRLYRLLQNAGHDDIDERSIQQITRMCHHCQINGTSPQRFRFTLRDDREFNYEIIADVLQLDGRQVLHIIDDATAFQGARFLKSMSAKDTWEALRMLWIDTYQGPPDIIRHDAGTNFAAEEFQKEARLIGITCRQVPIEAHNSIGKIERSHGPLRRAYNILKEEIGDAASPEAILQMAVKAVNDTAGPDGLVPTLLVFGAYPRINQQSPPSPTMIKRAEAIRKAMISLRRAVAQRQVQDALNTRNGPNVDKAAELPLQSEVLVWREGDGWTGPWTIIANDGHQITIDHVNGPRQFRITAVKKYHRDPEAPDVTPNPIDADPPSIPAAIPMPVQRRRGRPKGSKNKPKTGTANVSRKETDHFEKAVQLRQEGRITTPGAPFEQSDAQEIDNLIAQDVFKFVLWDPTLHGKERLFNARMVREVKGLATQPYEKSRLIIQGYNDRDKDRILTQSPTVQRAAQRLLMAIAPSLSLQNVSLFLRDITQAYIQSRTKLSRTILARLPTELVPRYPAGTIIHVISPLLMLLAQLQQYVKIRIEGCLESDVPLTPSVRHVLSKANRAGRILALNGIMATSEMAIIKEKQLRRSTLKEGTQVVARFGPLSVHDARVRVARDEYNRRASQEDEARRIRKKRSREEVPFVRRWMRDLRSVARNSVTKWRLSEMRRRGGLTKADFRAYLDNPEQLCLHYRLFRELKHKGKIVNSFTWPEEYDVDIIDDAVLLLATEYHDRVSSRKALSLEVDGIEITQIHDIEAEGDENEVIKVEDANEAAPSADALI